MSNISSINDNLQHSKVLTMENNPTDNLGSVKAIGQSIDAKINNLLNELDKSVKALTFKSHVLLSVKQMHEGSRYTITITEDEVNDGTDNIPAPTGWPGMNEYTERYTEPKSELVFDKDNE